MICGSIYMLIDKTGTQCQKEPQINVMLGSEILQQL